MKAHKLLILGLNLLVCSVLQADDLPLREQLAVQVEQTRLLPQNVAWLTWPKSMNGKAEQETTAFELVYTNGEKLMRALVYQLPTGYPGPNLWGTYVLLTRSNVFSLQPFVTAKTNRCYIRHSKPWKSLDELAENEWFDITRELLQQLQNRSVVHNIKMLDDATLAKEFNRKVTSGQIKVITRTNPDTESLHRGGGTAEVHELRNMKGDLLGVAESEMLCVD